MESSLDLDLAKELFGDSTSSEDDDDVVPGVYQKVGNSRSLLTLAC